MVLSFSSQVLNIALGEAITDDPVEFFGSYEAGNEDGSFGGAIEDDTPVQMESGVTPKKITWFAVHNADSETAVITLLVGSQVLWSGSLAAGDTLSWSKEAGFAKAAVVIGGDTIAVDEITEQTSGAGVTVDGVLLKDGEVTTDTINEATPDAGVTADGVLLKDATVTTATIIEGSAGSGVTADGFKMKDSGWDATGLLTGVAYLGLTDNLAKAWTMKEGANEYLWADTRNDRERVTLGKILQVPSQAIDMADAAVALVYGTAGAGEVKLLSNLLFVDANSAGTEDLTLPAVATSGGVCIDIFNSGGESIVVKDVAAATILTIPTGKAGRVACNATNWFGLLGG